MTYSAKITPDYFEQLKALELPVRRNPSPYVLLHMVGDGKRAPANFNFQVYGGKKGLKLVVTDKPTLDLLLSGENPLDTEGKRVITIDDSGWGFPIGGVLCGAYDAETGQFYLREVEVEFFQNPKFKNKEYLGRYREKVQEIIREINPSVDETVIKVCSGYINSEAVESLRRGSYAVEVTRVGEPLQSWLEGQNREYVRRLVGRDVYYDPKELAEAEIPKRFDEVMKFVRENDLMHLVKTGWKHFQGKNF
jgi:hypothetical protein